MASGILSLPLVNLKELVAASATFQTLTDSTDSTGALDSVYIVARSASGSTAYARPFALVSAPEGQSLVESHGSHVGGKLSLLFEVDVDSTNQGEDKYETAYLAFTDTMGAIVDEMMQEQYNGGRLYVRAISTAIPPLRSGYNEKGDYFQIMYDVEYGLE